MPRVLASVAGWAGEIIVILNEEVTDGTDRIVESHGGRVYREAWKGFIAQKNAAAARASNPWLLNLDADEEVSPELQQEIRQVITRDDPAITAYAFPRCTRYCGRWIRHGDWYPDRVVRLWRQGKARWAGEEPHARLEVDGRLGRLRADLWHYSFDSISHQVGKIVPYQMPAASRRAATGRPPGPGELWLRPAWRFFRGYVLKRGFLDGWQGYYIARLNAFSTLTRCALVHEALAVRASTKPPAERPKN